MPDNNATTIAVLGAGSWGTALAILLARNGHQVLLWGHEPGHIEQLKQTRENNRYLPGVEFPDNLTPTADINTVTDTAQNFLIAVPSPAFRQTLQLLKRQHRPIKALVWATKGLEPGTGRLLSQVVTEEAGAAVPAAVISGPTFAREIAQNLPTALTVAATDRMLADTVSRWLHNSRVRVYTSNDIAGVQLGGAIKNVMAIAAGISDGLGFGANARAALITRGLTELTRLGVAMGGKAETFMGLTGAGDLILTCTDNTSRNRQVGLALGRGQALQTILKELGQEAEGVNTALELHQLAQQLGIELPITEQVYRVLYEDLSPQAAVEALLTREAKPE